MSDLYLNLINTPLGKSAARTLGLPSPVPLKRRRRNDEPFTEGTVLVGAATGAKAVGTLGGILAASPATVFYATGPESLAASSGAGSKAKPLALDRPGSERFEALVFDATGIRSPEQLQALYHFFHPSIRKLAANGRLLVLGLDPANCRTAPQAAAQRALEGFVRSLGKEVGRKGATANLIYTAANATGRLESSLRFFLSPRSAYVSGQVVRIARSNHKPSGVSTSAPLNGKVALVTGASRGIGEAIAGTLAKDGATVIALDVPAASEALNTVASQIQGLALTCDITDPQAPDIIADFIEQHCGGVDLVIHNAGVTRDKTLGNMPEHSWDLAIAVNLAAEEQIDETLLERSLLRENGRIVCVSSISGIAGNFGQSNYAAAKSGVIGYVESMARKLGEGRTINAVAPGFIETEMTAAMPLMMREAGRRMNSLSQGGEPVDVAETIAWFCHPDSGGINGNTVRVCGQSVIGK